MPEDCLDQCSSIPILLHSQPDAEPTALATIRRVEIIPQQADNDERLTELWLHGRPATTQAGYRADVDRMFRFPQKSLRMIVLADMQNFADALEVEGLADATRHRILSATKSLFGFAHRLGYVQFDVGRALRLPGLRNRLAERILDEGEVQRMLAVEANPRNRMIVTLLYAAGLRISELAALKWRDCIPRDSGGQVTVEGKGGRVRSVLLPGSIWCALAAIRRGAEDEAPVFRSREKGHLHRAQLLRIVRRAARRAGIEKNVSPHWLRHAHVSHSLDRGCPVHVVSQTVGHSSLSSTTRYAHARPSESSATYLPL